MGVEPRLYDAVKLFVRLVVKVVPKDLLSLSSIFDSCFSKGLFLQGIGLDIILVGLLSLLGEISSGDFLFLESVSDSLALDFSFCLDLAVSFMYLSKGGCFIQCDFDISTLRCSMLSLCNTRENVRTTTKYIKLLPLSTLHGHRLILVSKDQVCPAVGMEAPEMHK